MTDDLGTLDPSGPTLRFERIYEHPIDKVWAAVSDPAHQAVWFPQQILGERRAGASLRFVTSVDPDDGFDGEMVAYDPPHLMEMRWGQSSLRIELHAEGDRTRLVLTEVLDDLGGGARNGAGWHECLDRLTAVITDTTPLRWGRRWHDVHPDYLDRFPAAAATLTAPEGWDEHLPDDPYAPRFDRYPEPTMTSFTYSVFIAANPRQVWDALTDPATSAKFWGHQNVSDWKVGSRWEHQRIDGSGIADVIGSVLEAEPPNRLVTTWADPKTPDEYETISIDIAGNGEIVRLDVRGEGFGTETERDETLVGFSAVLSNLKSLLETGATMPTPPWEMT